MCSLASSRASFLTWCTRRVEDCQRPFGGIAKKGKGGRTQRSSSCRDGTSLCPRRTSTSPLFRQTLTRSHGGITHPPGQILYWDGSEMVDVIAHTQCLFRSEGCLARSD